MSEFNFTTSKLMHVPVDSIRIHSVTLRPVEKESEEYLQGLDSVKKHGVMTPITLREVFDPSSGEKFYGLIDGAHRLTWAKDAGLKEIPANVGSLEEGNLLEAQILLNARKIETKPVQYAKALQEILSSNPTLTIPEMASRLSCSPQWLNDRLGLLHLDNEIQKQVDSGVIVATNGVHLAKLPIERQKDFVQQAIAKSPAEFIPIIGAVLKEIRQARAEGRKAVVDEFIAYPHIQKMPVIKDEADLAKSKPEMSKLIQQAKANNVTNVEQAVAYTLAWVLNLDPVSVANAKAAWEAEKEAKKKAAEERAAKKAAIKNAIAAAKAAEIVA